MNLSTSTPLWPAHRVNLTVPEGCEALDLSSVGFVPWNNPENIISQETEQIVDTIVGTVCLPVLFLISVPCNILSMLVFWKQGLKERINLCLFYISVVDLVHMLVNFLFNVERIRLPFAISVQFGPMMEFIVDHFLIGFVRGVYCLSGFITMVIASERCLCVVSPLHSQTFLKTQTMAGILIAASIIILSGSMFVGLRWKLVCVFDPENGQTSDLLYNSHFYLRHKAVLDVLTFFIVTLQIVIYVGVVSVTTVVTIVKLKGMVTRRAQMTSSSLSSREVTLTRMLIAVSVLFIVCSMPYVITGISFIFVPGIAGNGRHYNFANLLVNLTELGSFVNATFNFFLYSFVGSRFKTTLCELFSCKTVKSVSEHNHPHSGV